MVADAGVRARNLEIMAERLGWPDGALGVVQSIERMFSNYGAWWGTGRAYAPRVGFYARRKNSDWRDPVLYGAQPDELIAGIQRDMQRVADEREASARPFRKDD